MHKHYNLVAIAEAPNFPMIENRSIARNCFAFVIHQREWKLGWQEETFQVFSNLHGGGALHNARQVLRMFGQTQWEQTEVRPFDGIATAEYFRKMQKCFYSLGMQCWRNAHCSYTNLSKQDHYEILFPHEDVFYYLTFGCWNLLFYHFVI